MGRWISEGRSVRVTLPASSNVPQGAFALVQGFLGWAPEGATTGASQTAALILNTDRAEYETSQLDTALAYNVGDLIMWDPATNRFTSNAAIANGRKAGRCTSGKDSNNVIQFVFLGDSAQRGD
jgi:hypothetical protein